MLIQFEVKMTDKIMYDFLLYNNYTHMSGIFGALLGVVGLWIGIRNASAGNAQTALFGFAVAFIFLILTPLNLRKTAKRQVAGTEMFQKPLKYELNEEGITVRQGEQEAANAWAEFSKAVSTNRAVIVYVTRMRALIFPKESMDGQYEEIVKMISTHMPPAKVKIRHIH